MDDKTRTRTIDIEPGYFVRADGVRTDDIEEADKYLFRAAIFTDGEASDGDIIDVRSLKTGTMPLFMQHMADPTMQLGELTNPKVVREGSRNVVIWDGVNELGGVGELRDIRRDVAYRQRAGQLTSYSGRWGYARDGGTKVTRRVNLPKTHSAYIDGGKAAPDDIRQFGSLWEGAEALEGSLVGLPADQAATAREGFVRDFWAKQREATAAADDEDYEKIEPSKPEVTPLRLLELAIENARDNGVSQSDIASAYQRAGNAAVEFADTMREFAETLGEIQTQLDDLLHIHLADEPERVEGEPTPEKGETTLLDAEGLRDRFGTKRTDTVASDTVAAVKAKLRRLQGKPTE